MKKVIKMSAMMLTLFVVAFMTSCSGNVNPDVKAVGDSLEKFIELSLEMGDDPSQEDMQEYLVECAKIGMDLAKYNDSSVELTEADAEYLVDALDNMAKAGGEKISSKDKKDTVKEFTGATLGEFLEMFWQMMAEEFDI